MADATVFAPEMAVSSPKKRSRPRRKQKNDMPKTNLTNTQETADIGSGVPKTETEIVGQSTNPGSGKNVTSERKNAVQRPQNQQKKKNSGTPKKTNTTQLQNNTNVPKATQSKEERSKQTECSPQDMSRKEKRNQMYLDRLKVERERMKNWYPFFKTKPSDLLMIDRNKVVLLKSMDKLRPQAQFVCKVCNYYCDSMPVVFTHVRKPTHLRQLQDYKDEITLRELPKLKRDQMAQLNAYLTREVESCGMDSEDLETRTTIAVLVSDLVTSSFPGCSIRLFGSSIHGLGLKTADVNIDLQVPKNVVPSTMLKEVAAVLGNSDQFVNVVENFNCEFPFVSFIYKKSGEQCSISLNNDRAVSLAILLSKYTPLDPRLAQLATLFRYWGQLTETDKPQDGTWPGYAFYLMTVFYLQQCTNPVLPVLNDFLAEKGESESSNSIKILSMNVNEIKEKWRTNNNKNLASLWVGLLKFYTIDFNYTENIVCIDSSVLIPRKTRKIFIVDPFLPTRNVARSVTCITMFNYIMGCLMTTCKYFSMPQSKSGPLFGEIYVPATKYLAKLEDLLFAHNRINSQAIEFLMKFDSHFGHPKPGSTEGIAELLQSMRLKEFYNIDNLPIHYLERRCAPPPYFYRNMAVSCIDAKKLVSKFPPQKLEYNFTNLSCTGGLKVPRICTVCKREGHMKDDCPEEKLPPLEILPERTPEALKVLDNLCHHVFEKWKQSDEDIQMREDICEELQEFITSFYPTAVLELFGSTKNGFGLKGSDMDICLTFEDNKTGEGLDTRAFIEVLYKLLRSFTGVQDLYPIATAKVPIVKFTHRATKLDGDISLYNVLAMENSKLLCTYTKIDERARILGYIMKRFSKVCHIGDASKGSLSSYAYSLLVIYFLQQCKPPVLPVLQELTESNGPPPRNNVEGCNAYFFKDIEKLDKVWPGKGQNTLSVGELWLNLLIYYTEQFDMINNVICIRCSHVVTKFEKLWISKGIAIEDPFDLSHNLGSALTRKMSLYIIKALRKGRNHFGLPMNPNSPRKNIEAYFLNVEALTEGEPPNDRGCRICKSIGHKERDCPEKKKKGWSKQNKKKESISKNDTPTRNAPAKIAIDEEDLNDDDDDDDDSNSDKESSDQEVAWHKNSEKEGNKKSEPVSLHKRAFNPEVTRNSDRPPRISSTEIDQLSQSNVTVPPGFIARDTDHNPPAHFGLFTAHPTHTTNSYLDKTPQMCLNTNIANAPRMINNQSPDASFVPQTPINNDKNMQIPTIVFNNSKLTAEPAHKLVNPVRFLFNPGQEPSRPPPGFIPLSQNGLRFPNSVPFHHEQTPAGQNTWNFKGIPFFTPMPMTSPKVDFMCNMPMYASPSSPSTLTPSGAPPRPHIRPVFNNLHLSGMVGQTEQIISGQSISFQPSVSQGVFPLDSSPVHNLDASVAKLNLDTSLTTNVTSLVDLAQEELKTIQQDFSKNESELNSPQNKTIEDNYPVSSNNIVSNST